MVGTLYFIGCIFATVIVINEFLHQEQKEEKIEEYDETIKHEHQYGLAAIVILLSWVSVIIWGIGNYKYLHKNKN